jgi:hypothetical protein
VKAQIRSKTKTSPFRLQTTVTPRGVFFDRLDGSTKMLMIHTSNRQARLLAQWILDHVPAED